MTTRKFAQAVVIALACAVSAHAQSIPGAVLATKEPHHHLAYEDSTLRVLRVRVPAHDTTLLHEHDPDYFWIALGASTVVNARLGSPDATITSKDLSIHYSFGPFAHVARNPADVPFDNITVELLEKQTNVSNLCEEALSGAPLACSTSSGGAPVFFAGAADHPAFDTAQLRVLLLTVAPGATLRPTKPFPATWLIVLDSADAGRDLVIDKHGAWHGGVFSADSGGTWAIRNRGRLAKRVIAVVRHVWYTRS